MSKALVVTLAIAGLAGCAQMQEMMHEKGAQGTLVACPADKVSIGDVPSCGKIWKLTWGTAELKSTGDLTAEVQGLVLNDFSTGSANGTTDGVDGVAAAVLCRGPNGILVAAQADVVPLDSKGNAKVKQHVNVPSCIAPIIVLRERYQGKIGGWLAATGF